MGDKKEPKILLLKLCSDLSTFFITAEHLKICLKQMERNMAEKDLPALNKFVREITELHCVHIRNHAEL